MAEAPAGFGKVVLFHQGAPGGLTYRIPALLYLPSESAFLAFAEERSSPRDEDARFLVMRRGQKQGTSVQWGPQESLMTATLPGHRTMNPCPLYERSSRTVFLFFICVQTEVTEQQQLRRGKNAARLCYVSSRDGGRTWSQTTDLTEKAITDNLRRWATFAVGPGHGLQLSSGRLVVPAYAYYIHRRCFGHPLTVWTKPHSFMFYSDDGGRNWSQGRLLRAVRTSECQVAELTGQDNRPVLYCNARSPDRYRAEAFSADHGEFFDESFFSEELCEPPNGCQGSVMSFSPMAELGVHPSSASYENTKQWLIFSHPTNKRHRLDLGIYLNMSPMEKGSWKGPWVLNKGPSGYSDLAVCKERKSLLFGCLFECGAANSYEEIAFKLFTDAELLREGRF
ncbi:sialidase-3 [Anolis carolinensis]|uniref:exo-alpha-sialidase n=1 Tax=Anolis carolinensis TaxID=28377 RepID=H9GQ66_ANOCA|nr:PREDICTED: sialidase-3 [Anolis carolinensis]DAA35237.1 TPA_inf: sialidase NEU3.2 [Anolis carolinensis]|eukprot:XP_008118889.1 PREDICTED: sialidase-3 [Anolis carolinensis]